MSQSMLSPDPLSQFIDWHSCAHTDHEVDPDAMTLSTASKAGKPSARMVLFKGVSEGGFMFFTNDGSRKIQDVAQNPAAALTFYWARAYRQVRVEGLVTSVSDQESDRYFAQRPRESQLAAWASQQSTEISGREILLKRYAEYEQKFKGQDVPRPGYWKGHRLMPELIEFWQGLDHRMHDRFCYHLRNGAWEMTHLAP